MLYVNFIFFFLIGAYLFEIVPQEYGVTRSPLFPFSMLKNFVKKKVNKGNRHSEHELEEDAELKYYIGKKD